MRGEGNHKIPGSFAPENMEKTGAERVKYSLACQHEDAISIKFVSYAQKCPTVLCTFAVALRKESVDRNCISVNMLFTPTVALRKESVDRNSAGGHIISQRIVALRKESVDRNTGILPHDAGKIVSLSARRAWIEITIGPLIFNVQPVALRKESVDRNQQLVDTSKDIIKSLSARRAWIEMRGAAMPASIARSLSARRAWIEMMEEQHSILHDVTVALRKESVDRN